MFGKIHGGAEERGRVDPVDQAVDDVLRHQLEVANLGKHRWIDETRAGDRRANGHCQLSAISYRLSAIGYQLSAISFRLSAFGYQLSTGIRKSSLPSAAFRLPSAVCRLPSFTFRTEAQAQP